MRDGDDFARRLADRCGVPRRFAALELEDMDDYGDRAYRKMLEKLRGIGEELREGRGVPLYLYLCGKLGSGKTRAAAWLLGQFYLHVLGARATLSGRQPLFISAAKLVDFRFRRNWEDEEDAERWEMVREQLFRSSFLVIDDVSRIAGYKGEEAFLERVVEERYNEELSVVLTGNAGDGDFGERFRDFLAYFEEVALVGRTRRERAK